MSLIISPFSTQIASPFNATNKLVVSPFSTQIASPFNTYNATNNLVVSPFSTYNTQTASPYNAYNTQLYTTSVLTPAPAYLFADIDPGLNDSYIAQKEMTEYLLYRILDKWLYTDDMCHVLKYLKVNGNKVEQITSESEIKGNKICNDSVEDVEKKADYIQEHLLSKNEMRKLLQRMINELGYKWYNLSQKEDLVVDVVERYLNKKLKERIGK